MKKLILSRAYNENQTAGTYMVMDGLNLIYQCSCLELAWLDNQRSISCIPEGTYEVEKYNSAKYKNAFWIKNVPDRDAILIHKGNFATGDHIDTEGCQLPGMYFADIDGNGNIDVVQSGKAMDALNKHLPDKFKIIIC